MTQEQRQNHPLCLNYIKWHGEHRLPIDFDEEIEARLFDFFLERHRAGIYGVAEPLPAWLFTAGLTVEAANQPSATAASLPPPE